MFIYDDTSAKDTELFVDWSGIFVGAAWSSLCYWWLTLLLSATDALCWSLKVLHPFTWYFQS